MSDRQQNDNELDRVATLTATCDQLQAEVDRHAEALALLFGALVGTCVLIVMLEVKLRRVTP
jgi:hypothetical protein